jgi:hypothetical protein
LILSYNKTLFHSRIGIITKFIIDIFGKILRLMKRASLAFLLMIIILPFLDGQTPWKLNNQKIDGFRGIWFELNRKLEYGDKYSGGLGTYTADHIPMAIYAPAVNKTFFVFGGTTRQDEKHLLAMIGVYDHSTGMVSKPTVVCDKGNVIDPHDNQSMLRKIRYPVLRTS